MRRLPILAVLLGLLVAAVPATAASNTVGVVGCSQARDAIKGIDALGVEGYWPSTLIRRNYDGGTVDKWLRFGDRSKYWSAFDSGVAQYPPDVVWFELCVGDPNRRLPRNYDDYDAALAVVNEIKAKVPGVTVVVSAMPAYEGDLCALSGGNYGPDTAQDVVNRLGAAGAAVVGPVMGPLTVELVGEDGCHANDAGAVFQAQQLDAYFP